MKFKSFSVPKYQKLSTSMANRRASFSHDKESEIKEYGFTIIFLFYQEFEDL